MNAEQVGGIVRTILAGIGGVAVSKGLIDDATMLSIAGALGTIAVAVWSVIAKRRAAAAK